MKFLIVEDDDLYADFLGKLLARWKFESVVAYTVAQGIEAILKQKFDFILLGINLPDGLGTDLIPIIKDEQPLANIITVSGLTSLQLQQDLHNHGIRHHLQKPFKIDELKRLIDQLEFSRPEKPINK
jgi:DNA-binding response OmpR family regulator